MPGSGVVTDVAVVEWFVRLLRERAPGVERVRDICRAQAIDLAITDGLVDRDLGDAIDGNPVRLGVMAAGWNAQAVDVVGCRVMQADPQRSLYLSYLRAAGFGPISDDEIEVLGDEVAAIAKPFTTPDPRKIACRTSCIGALT